MLHISRALPVRHVMQHQAPEAPSKRGKGKQTAIAVEEHQSHWSPSNLQQTRRPRLATRATQVGRISRVDRLRTGASIRRRSGSTRLKAVSLYMRRWCIVGRILCHHPLRTEIRTIRMRRVCTSIAPRLPYHHGIILMWQLAVSAPAGTSCRNGHHAGCLPRLCHVAQFDIIAVVLGGFHFGIGPGRHGRQSIGVGPLARNVERGRVGTLICGWMCRWYVSHIWVGLRIGSWWLFCVLCLLSSSSTWAAPAKAGEAAAAARHAAATASHTAPDD